jgi:hypothetical protein
MAPKRNRSKMRKAIDPEADTREEELAAARRDSVIF